MRNKEGKKKYLAVCLLVFVLCTADHLTDVFLTSGEENLAEYIWRDFMLKLCPGKRYSLMEIIRSMWILFLSLFVLGAYMWEPYACSAVYLFGRNHKRLQFFTKRSIGAAGWVIMMTLSYGITLLVIGLFNTGEMFSVSSVLTFLYVMVYAAETIWIFVSLSNLVVLSLGEVIGCSFAAVMILICIILQQNDGVMINILNPLSITFHSAFSGDAVIKLLINAGILLIENVLVIRQYARYDIVHQDTMI